MPGYDRTGPVGRGSMTGRGLGCCAGGRWQVTGIGQTGFRGRFGERRGQGFGRARSFRSGSIQNSDYFGPRVGNRRYPQANNELELNDLEQEAKGIRGYLKDLENQIREIKKTSA